MKKPLKLWAKEQLNARFGNILLKGAEWENPPTSSSLKCNAFIAIKCPYEKGHKSKHRKNKTETILMVTSTGAAMVFCHHSSCTEQLQKLNAQLRANQWRAWFADELEEEPPRMSREEIEQRRQARASAEEAIKEAHEVTANPLSLEELIRLSPFPVADLKPDEMLRRHLSLFPPQDLLWVGESPYQSHSAVCYKTAQQFQSELPKWAVYVTGSSYKSASGGRRTDNLGERRFCVFENDRIGKERTAALFRHAEGRGLKLAAVVDSGGKSAHGWVVEDGETERWRDYFKACGFCSRAMRATQPVRLAGAVRQFKDDREPTLQRLLYLNEGVLPWRS